MKNAMKKLTSLLLVAVLLVGALPFGASAAEGVEWIDVVKKLDESVQQGAPVNNAEIIPEVVADVAAAQAVQSVQPVQAERAAQMTTVTVMADGKRLDGREFTVPTGSTPYEIFTAYTNAGDAVYIDGSEFVKVTDIDGNTIDGAVNQSIARLWIKAGNYSVTLKLTVDGKVTEQRYDGLSRVDAEAQWDEAFKTPAVTAGFINSSVTTAKYDIVFSSTESAKNGNHYIVALTAKSKEIVIPGDNGADLVIPGYGSNTPGSGNSGNGGNNATTASYVDVITNTNKTSNFNESDYYRCYLVNGKITQTDRNVIASQISGKNIIAWKRADNGTQASSLVDFDFTGLAQPINIFPVVNKSTSGTNDNTNNNNSNNNNDGYVADPEFQHDIWLYIYTNNDIIQPAKRVLLNNYLIVKDDVLDKNEILSVVDDYYTASNANTGIVWQGAYKEDTLDVIKFVFKYDEAPFTNLGAARTAGTVVIKARVTGVNAISSAAADTSNPKTGDSIYTAVAVMGISAASLAAVMYVYNKKRMAM